ncbi:MAG: hypothetical protein HUU38_10205 [Anaerolineales bacterium]|nr:hypothetical protein [Anaerolineales bacterium]
MQRKSIFTILVSAGILLAATGFWLATAPPTQAQCGSQASSCKNCHEVQAELPVNADGTGWHQSHAFGDFCYICHAGNNQATDKAAAHDGMVPPLADVQAACQQCHVADLTERAQVYATTLGVEIGAGSTAPGTGSAETASVSAPTSSGGVVEQSCNEIVVDDPNVVNYAQHYDEIVLGKKTVNWGNMILMGMIGALVVGGGGFVVNREKLVNFSFGDTRKVDEEYPAEVVELLPKIAALKPGGRKALANLLNNPKKAGKVLDLVDTLESDKADEA